MKKEVTPTGYFDSAQRLSAFSEINSNGSFPKTVAVFGQTEAYEHVPHGDGLVRELHPIPRPLIVISQIIMVNNLVIRKKRVYTEYIFQFKETTYAD